MTQPDLTDQQLLRYSRQLLLPAFGAAEQAALRAARVLVIGAGGLGCPLVMYLAAAGVGEITIADDDRVEIANLQRQIAFAESDIGAAKAQCLAARAASMNADCQLHPLVRRLSGDDLQQAVDAADLVLDASDNFATRFAVNAACIAARKPLVSGAAIRGEGQVSVFDSRQPTSPCYQCLYPAGDDEALRCVEAGVIGPLVGIIGATQAMEAIKLLTGLGQPLTGRLLLLDAWQMQWRELRLPRDPACLACGAAGKAVQD